MPRLRFVQNLTDEIRQPLEDLYRHHASFALRQRAHAILLNARGFTIPQLQAIFAVDRDTISAWITRFEQFGIDGLRDARVSRPDGLISWAFCPAINRRFFNRSRVRSAPPKTSPRLIVSRRTMPWRMPTMANPAWSPWITRLGIPAGTSASGWTTGPRKASSCTTCLRTARN